MTTVIYNCRTTWRWYLAAVPKVFCFIIPRILSPATILRDEKCISIHFPVSSSASNCFAEITSLRAERIVARTARWMATQRSDPSGFPQAKVFEPTRWPESVLFELRKVVVTFFGWKQKISREERNSTRGLIRKLERKTMYIRTSQTFLQATIGG